jgi:parallel beta-helix repeat protein
MAKLNASWSLINGGDSVLFHKGETFSGTIVIGKSGTSTSPIIIASYPNGTSSAKPVITGLTTLSTWTLNSAVTGGNIYRSTTAAFTLQMVVVNGTPVGQGRYPDNGYFTVTSSSGTSTTSTVTATAMPTSPVSNWFGAEIATREQRYRLDRYKIASQSGTTITYNDAHHTDQGSGFFIINDPRTLTKKTEWYYTAGHIDMFFPTGESPSGNTIQVSTRNNLIYSSAFSNITIRDLTLTGANADAIFAQNCSNFSVYSCDILNSGECGFHTEGVNNTTVDNCQILRSENNAVFVGKMFSSADRATITNNIIDSSDFIPGMAQNGQYDGWGVTVWPGNSLIANNRVTRSGYTAIGFFNKNTIVRNNFVRWYCSTKDDGGGIYTWGPAQDSIQITLGKSIINNIVMDAIGAPVGTSTDERIDGIYTDDHSNNVSITGNTVINAGSGLHVHNASSNVIRNNTFYNNRGIQALFKHDAIAPNSPNVKHRFTKNILFSLKSNQRVLHVRSYDASPNTSTGILDSNWYTRPINDSTSATTIAWRQNSYNR